MSSETELAWAAGFWDGEGCTSFQRVPKRTHNRARMTLDQAGEGAEEILDRFMLAVGGRGRIYGPYQKPTGKKTSWNWSCYVQSEVEEVVALLTPYLSSVKLEQAYGVLNGRGDPPSRKHTHCKSGLHLLSETEVFVTSGGRTWRECGVCRCDRHRRHNQVSNQKRKEATIARQQRLGFTTLPTSDGGAEAAG